MGASPTEPPAPSDGELALHPRLTVVVGASPGLVERLRTSFTALAGRATGEAVVDPVLELAPPRWHPAVGHRPVARPSGAVPGAGASPPPPPPVDGPLGADPHLPPPMDPAAEGLPVADPAAASRARAWTRLEAVEGELRIASGERMVLERRIADVRVDLDPFASASLEATRARLAELTERAEAAHGRAAQQEGRRTRVEDLERQVADLDAEERRLARTDPSPVREAADALEAELALPGAPDPAALRLAARLVSLAREADASRARAAALGELAAEARSRLDGLRAELDAARSGGPTGATADVVARLEAVRDRIFALSEDGRGRRARDEVDELRAQEAELLDRLGYDTYTDYVLGAASEPARVARAVEVELAEARVQLVAAEVERLDAMAGVATADVPDRGPLVEEAARLLDVDLAAVGRLTTDELVHLLERPGPPGGSPGIPPAAAVLAARMAEVDAAPGAAARPTEVLAAARRWLSEVGDARPARRTLAERRARLGEEIDALRAELGAVADDAEEAAAIDHELEAALARLADDEERLARHDDAAARLAELRAEDLRLAEREERLRDEAEGQRRLLEVLGADPAAGGRDTGEAPGPAAADVVDAAAAPAAVPTDVRTAAPTDVTTAAGTGPTGTRGGPSATHAAGPAGATAVAGVVGPAGPSPVDTSSDRPWRILERAARLRSVPGVGPVPLLVLGLDAAGDDVVDVLRRVERLSAVLQVVATTDDEGVAAWAEQLGPDVALVVRP